MLLGFSSQELLTIKQVYMDAILDDKFFRNRVEQQGNRHWGVARQIIPKFLAPGICIGKTGDLRESAGFTHINRQPVKINQEHAIFVQFQKFKHSCSDAPNV